MRKAVDFESDDPRILRIRPHMMKPFTKQNPSGELAYITIYTCTSKIHINRDNVAELAEMFTAVKETYIDKLDLLK